MTSLLNTHVNNSQKKLLGTFSVHRTKTLKKNDNLNFENTMNLNAKTKHGQRKNEEKKQIISTFQISKEVPSGNQTNDNNFSNIDILKDSNYFGNNSLTSKSFLNRLNYLGFEGIEQLENTLITTNQPSSLKRVKTSPDQQPIHIDPPKNFFEELTPDIFQSKVMPGNHNNNSIRENESMMYFFDIKQPNLNKSIVYPKNISSQVLSPSHIYDNQSSLIDSKKNIKLELQDNDMHSRTHLQYGNYDRQSKVKTSNVMKKSPENCFWIKDITSPLKDFNPKSIF